MKLKISARMINDDMDPGAMKVELKLAVKKLLQDEDPEWVDKFIYAYSGDPKYFARIVNHGQSLLKEYFDNYVAGKVMAERRDMLT